MTRASSLAGLVMALGNSCAILSPADAGRGRNYLPPNGALARRVNSYQGYGGKAYEGGLRVKMKGHDRVEGPLDDPKICGTRQAEFFILSSGAVMSQAQKWSSAI